MKPKLLGRMKQTGIVYMKRGNAVVSGVYFYKMRAGEFTMIRKIALER